MIDGSCRSDTGRHIMDRFFDAPMGDKSTAKDKARRLCGGCSVLAECDEWITRAEYPAGAWHGMFAALTPLERRRRADWMKDQR